MYKIQFETNYAKAKDYFEEYLSKDEAIKTAIRLIEDGLASYYKEIMICRITSNLHPNEVIVVRSRKDICTYKIPTPKK